MVDPKYEIRDWADNLMYKFGMFDSTEDAWDYLLDKFSDDAELDEYLVCEIED